MSNDAHDAARRLIEAMSGTAGETGKGFLANAIARHVVALFESKPEISIGDVIAALEREASGPDPRVAAFNQPAIDRLRELEQAHKSTG